MYIDGVFSGGGAKGIALAGAYQELERNGFRFVRLAGTSVGSIVAALIAAGYTSEEMIKLLNELDNDKILDQPYPFLSLNALRWISIYWRLGLYKGEKFEKWVSAKLKKKGIAAFSDLPPNSLKLIASDLTNGKLMVLPDDLPSYGINPATFSVARAIRMSSSLPYFFEPVKLQSNQGVCIVVDGGVLSNFPIWLFSEQRKRPIIGVTLAPNEKERPKNSIKQAFELFGALFETMKDAHDARHIATRHERDIIFIPVDHVQATDFSLSKEKKAALFALGRTKTESFLKKWSY